MTEIATRRVSNRHFVPLSGGRFRFDGIMTGWLGLVFLLALFWFTCGNNYPSFYEAGEEDWAKQVLADRPDFHEPLLLFTATRALKTVLKVPDDLQSVVETGRTVSAFFGAGSIVALCLVIYFIQGRVAAILTSFFLMGQHLLFEQSHVMNPETSLLFGVSLTLLGIVLFEQEPTIRWSLFLGVGMAVAISAGPIGLLMAIPALLVVLRFGAAEMRFSRRVEFLLGFLLALLVINFSAVVRLPEIVVRLFNRFSHGFAQSSFQSAYYWRALMENTTPFIWVMLGFVPVIVWMRRKEMSCSVKVFLLFPVAFFIVLLISPDQRERHLLPVVVFLYTVAVGAVQAVRTFAPIVGEGARSGFSIALNIMFGVALFFEAIVGIPYYRAFNRDDRSDLLTWMAGNLQPGTKVLADSMVFLPELMARTKERYPFAVLTNVPDKNEAHDQWTDGADYAIVSGPHGLAYGSSKEDGIGAFENEYSVRGTLVWERPSDKVLPLHPGLRLYHVLKGARSEAHNQ
jgi:hypothetical protein